MSEINPAIFTSDESILITFLASFLIWFMFLAAFYLWIVRKKFEKRQFFQLMFASFIAWLLAETMKRAFPTFRPFEINGGNPLTLTIPGSNAFPSVHAATSMGLASGVWYYDRKIGAIFIILGVLVGIGRVLGNVHFLIDILVGSFLGILATIVVFKFRPGKILS